MAERILIIDDEDHIRRMMRLALQASGYRVGEAKDGAEGIDLFGNGSRWDVVILDQRMPGLNGLETLAQLKQRNPNTRVVMATAYASIELAVDAMKLGATDFVRKPMTPEVLRKAITAALSKSTSTQVMSVSAPAQKPMVQTITMNGFTILDDEPARSFNAAHRRFVILSPDGDPSEVLVEIDAEAIDYVRRMIGWLLPAENSFWTSEARRLLSDFLWHEGKVPPTRRLVLKDLEPERVLVASRWKWKRGA